MIKLIEIYIEEFRGIRKLTLKPNGKNFVIHGPNGSGKSGVVDAIDFGLTGNISRLAGKGTGSLSLKTHGPHVDARDSPNASLVRLKLELCKLGKIVTIERRLSKPKELIIQPDDPEIRAVLSEIAQHSEITLSRREIIKYILSEGATRARDVQALLKLDDLSQLRGTFKTAANKLSSEERNANTNFTAAANDLKQHLGVQQLTVETILSAINSKRQILNLPDLIELTEATKVSDGLDTQSDVVQPFSQSTALSDLDSLEKHLKSPDVLSCVSECVVQFDFLNQDLDLLQQLKRANFYKQGLDLFTEDEDACPLCDTEWEFDSLVVHIQMKIERAKTAQVTCDNLVKAASRLQTHIRRTVELLRRAKNIACAVGKNEEGENLDEWASMLESTALKIAKIEGLLEAEDEVRKLYKQTNSKFTDAISAVHSAVLARPNNSRELEARDFLIIAEERRQKCREAKYEVNRKKQASDAASIALKMYNKAVEETLGGLYSQVESNLADYYCFVNHEDESQFRAKLEHKEATLNLEVDFYSRGLFPPSAYHSEGHQDSMGLCLYLALMRQLLRDEFTFVVLDDVVMSVDTQHRREVCRLFKEKFPGTQFVLTTHEQAWHRQMVAHGLISRKSSVIFRSWTVEHGPLAAESPEIWAEIDEDLRNNNVSAAAAKLRRHLEYVAREIAEPLRAQVTFKGDGNYDLGGLLPSALSRIPQYLKTAKKAAQSWKDNDAEKRAEVLLSDFQARQKAVSMEQWAINPAVHYNEWENFSREDFMPVVKAYRELLSLIYCEQCETWLYVSPLRGDGESFRCTCARTNLNLKNK
ncbi:AAA family ATPase [Nodosilinea sp. PGN35]|uniref:AAA family ATPase n=1 Tax=Nodosilinea sp. PGN35 TaxID=3020489 RepID=UPI0023B2F638|nr:AAA family ATPase [Nodosilinea sp. TSF1-S3]MDF0366332.1 AAA family ATPase [Nodosilinea sp. TSF1-S3]